MLNDDILAKIQKLETLASRATNPHEAAVALSKLQDLLQKHDLDTADLGHLQPERGDIIETNYGEVGNIIKWKLYIIQTISHVNNCRVILNVSELYYSHEGQQRNRTVKGRNYIIVGKPGNVNATIYMINNIISQVERMCDAAVEVAHIPNYETTKSWKNAWKIGAASAICERLLNDFKAKTNQDQAYALLVLSRNQALDQYIKDGGYKKTYSPAKQAYNHDALYNGYSAGEKITVQSAAAAGISNTAGLLEE